MVDGQKQLGYYNAVYQPYYEENEATASGVMVLAFDVTENVLAKQQEEQIRAEAEKQKRLYETITTNIPDLIYVFDLSYRFTYANKALLDMWGKKWDDSIGKGLRENGYEEWHAQMHEQEIDQVVATKSAIRGEVSFPHATLGERIYDYIFVPVLTEEGEVEAVAGTTRDITEIKLAEKKIAEGNRLFQNLADESPIFVFLIDAGPLAPVSYWNKTWLTYTGRTYEEAVGRAWDGIIHPDDVPVVMAHYTPAYETMEAYLIPAVRVKRHDGAYRWHAFKGNPRYLPSGQFDGYVGVGFDIHDQKLAEDVLKESEARARAAIDIARLGTFEINVQEQTITQSRRNAEILGLDPNKQWTYQSIVDTVHPDDRAIRTKALEEAKHTGELFYEARIVRPDQSIGWVRLNGRYVYQDHQPMIIGTLMDITAEKKTSEILETVVAERTAELKFAVGELEHSNRNLEEFAYAASHDLKEPVRKIHTFSDRLKASLGERLSETERHYFDRMELASKRMGTLIDDLLMYSHVSRGAVMEEAIDLNQKVKVVLNDLELEIEEKKATVTIDTLPTIRGHRRQLQQLFQNLVSNALKYSKPVITPQIHISCRQVLGHDPEMNIPALQQNTGYYLLEIKDNGIGFEQEDAEKIFNMFTRLHGISEYKGTGVGLAIVRRVVENHGGFIWAKSERGKGSTFYIALPAE